MKKVKKIGSKRTYRVAIIIISSIIVVVTLAIVLTIVLDKKFRETLWQGTVNINPISWQVNHKLERLFSEIEIFDSDELYKINDPSDFKKGYVIYKENGEWISFLGLKTEVLYDDLKLEKKYSDLAKKILLERRFTENASKNSEYKNQWISDRFVTFNNNDLICQLNISQTEYWKDCPDCVEFTGNPRDLNSPYLQHYFRLGITCGKAMDNIQKRDYQSLYSLLIDRYECRDFIVFISLNDQVNAVGSSGCLDNAFSGGKWLATKKNGKWRINTYIDSGQEPPTCADISRRYNISSDFLKLLPCIEDR